MRTLTVPVLTVNELSQKAFDKSYSQWLDHQPYGWHDENRKAMEVFSRLLPVNVTDWSYGGRGEGACFQMTCDDEVSELSGIRLLRWLVSNVWSDIFKGKYYGKLVYDVPISKEHPAGCRHVKRYSKVFFECSCPFTGFAADHHLTDPIEKFLKSPDNTTLEGLIDDCFKSWVEGCSDDFESSTNHEGFKESCEANEYEFYKNGEMI